MTASHHVVAILPARDIDSSEAFYRQLGLRVVSDYGNYRILTDGKDWHLHLNRVEGWPKTPSLAPVISCGAAPNSRLKLSIPSNCANAPMIRPPVAPPMEVKAQRPARKYSSGRDTNADRSRANCRHRNRQHQQLQ